MSVAVSDNVRSVLVEIGFDADLLNENGDLAELTIDTYDQWTNPRDSFVGPTGACAPSIRA